MKTPVPINSRRFTPERLVAIQKITIGSNDFIDLLDLAFLDYQEQLYQIEPDNNDHALALLHMTRGADEFKKFLARLSRGPVTLPQVKLSENLDHKA